MEIWGHSSHSPAEKGGSKGIASEENIDQCSSLLEDTFLSENPGVPGWKLHSKPAKQSLLSEERKTISPWRQEGSETTWTVKKKGGHEIIIGVWSHFTQEG